MLPRFRSPRAPLCPVSMDSARPQVSRPGRGEGVLEITTHMRSNPPPIAPVPHLCRAVWSQSHCPPPSVSVPFMRPVFLPVHVAMVMCRPSMPATGTGPSVVLRVPRPSGSRWEVATSSQFSARNRQLLPAPSSTFLQHPRRSFPNPTHETTHIQGRRAELHASCASCSPRRGRPPLPRRYLL